MSINTLILKYDDDVDGKQGHVPKFLPFIFGLVANKQSVPVVRILFIDDCEPSQWTNTHYPSRILVADLLRAQKVSQNEFLFSIIPISDLSSSTAEVILK